MAFLGVSVFSFAQEKSNFRFGDEHVNEGRSGYSIFYPITSKKHYKGVVVFLHDNQNINPKSYGGIIEHIVKQNFIVIYPHYQEFMISFPKNDMKYISEALNRFREDMEQSQSIGPDLPYIFIGHGTGAILAQNCINQEEYRNVRGALFVAPVHNRKNKITKNLSEASILILEEEHSKSFKKLLKEKETRGLKGRKIQTIVHRSSSTQKAKRTSFRSYNNRFSSEKNGMKDYFIRFDKPNAEDLKFYYPLLSRFLSCVIDNKECDYSKFTESLSNS